MRQKEENYRCKGNTHTWIKLRVMRYTWAQRIFLQIHFDTVNNNATYNSWSNKKYGLNGVGVMICWHSSFLCWAQTNHLARIVSLSISNGAKRTSYKHGVRGEYNEFGVGYTLQHNLPEKWKYLHLRRRICWHCHSRYLHLQP